jgi:hypothetical protein
VIFSSLEVSSSLLFFTTSGSVSKILFQRISSKLSIVLTFSVSFFDEPVFSEIKSVKLTSLFLLEIL